MLLSRAPGYDSLILYSPVSWAVRNLPRKGRGRRAKGAKRKGKEDRTDHHLYYYYYYYTTTSLLRLYDYDYVYD